MSTTEQTTLEVAQRGFVHFKQGLETGQWEPFLEMITDDFTFWFPLGTYAGSHMGREKAREFFQFVSQAYSQGLSLTLTGITSNHSTVVFEIRDEGILWGQPYKNRVAVSFDVRGNKICAYREYLGSDGQSN
jgi:ketosteroid isomerase-like protein